MFCQSCSKSLNKYYNHLDQKVALTYAYAGLVLCKSADLVSQAVWVDGGLQDQVDQGGECVHCPGPGDGYRGGGGGVTGHHA